MTKLSVLWYRPAERREGQLRVGRLPLPQLRRRLPVLLALQALRGAAGGQLRRGQRLRGRGHLGGPGADGGVPRQRRRSGKGELVTVKFLTFVRFFGWFPLGYPPKFAGGVPRGKKVLHSHFNSEK